MADLSVEFSGLRFRNPILIASSTLTRDIEKLKRLEQAGAGGIVTKLISNAPEPPAHTYPFRSFVLNDSWCIVGDRRLGLDEGIALIKDAKKKLKIPVIANFVGVADDEASWVEVGLALQEAGADMLEMDLNCPLGAFDNKGVFHQSRDDRGLHGLVLGENPSLTGKVVKALKQAIDIPIMPKIPPKMNFLMVAKACEDNGADAISAGNVFLGLPGVDIRNAGKPIYPFMEKGGFGPYQGAYLHPIANMYTAVLAQNSKKPICSNAGIMAWEHIIQRIMLGAHVVQLCSTVYINGLMVIEKCGKELKNYLHEYQYNRLEDLRGRALAYIVPFAETVVQPCVARIVDQKKCSDCEDLCFYRVNADCIAISLTERGMPHINEEKCTGCALCYWACDQKAIVMKEV